MRERLEVREFDVITSNPDYKDEYRYLSEVAFKDLTEFIKEYTSDDGLTDALEFMRLGYKRGVGETVSISNYVGIIQTPHGTQIEILPKIDFQTEKGSVDQTKRIFIKMLKSLRDFPVKQFDMANLRADKMNLYEIFICMYIDEVMKIVKMGIKSDYVCMEENLGFCKGKLLVTEHIKNNLGHRERFYVSYDEFRQNCAENRIIKATLEKLEALSEDRDNVKNIKKLLTFFDGVQSSRNYVRDFSSVTINRGNKGYKDLLEWSKIFLMNKSFTTFSGHSLSRALLFPMEKIFESYVARELRKILPDGWEISLQDREYYLFDTPRQFALRPDIVIRTDQGHTVIMDTKWKRLCDKRGRNYGISQQDMYQMYAYATKYQTKDVFLLYPATEEMRGRTDICFRSFNDGELIADIQVYFIDVSDIRNCLEDMLIYVWDKI